MMQTNISLLKYNTFGIDVKAARYLNYQSEQELLDFIQAGELTLPYLHIGAGSNLLFTKDYPGLILHSSIDGVEVVDETIEHIYLRVGAGVEWDRFVGYCVDNNWYGAENLSLIPGEVGASAVQDIGSYGVEVKDIIEKVESITDKGEKKTYGVDQCGYGYRESIFKLPQHREEFITYVTYKLSKTPSYKLDYGTVRDELDKFPEINLHTVRQVIIDIRRTKLPDPEVFGNAGSFFKNPVVSGEFFKGLQLRYPAVPNYQLSDGSVKIPAAWLIDQCGLKGHVLGNAAVHDKQPLVLVNKGGASGQEILALSDKICAAVKDKFDIQLSPEVTII